jgi:hypothetical protein
MDQAQNHTSRAKAKYLVSMPTQKGETVALKQTDTHARTLRTGVNDTRFLITKKFRHSLWR